jgi:hypothetical protein
MLPEHNIRGLLRNCDDGGVGVAANDGGHHRCIDDPQTFDAENPKIRVLQPRRSNDPPADAGSGRPAQSLDLNVHGNVSRPARCPRT